MNTNINNRSSTIKSSGRKDAPVFSLTESDAYYLAVVDIPKIPTSNAETLTVKNQLILEISSGTLRNKKTIFKLLPLSQEIKTTYKDGMLWLLLPKTKLEPTTKPIQVVAG